MERSIGSPCNQNRSACYGTLRRGSGWIGRSCPRVSRSTSHADGIASHVVSGATISWSSGGTPMIWSIMVRSSESPHVCETRRFPCLCFEDMENILNYKREHQNLDMFVFQKFFRRSKMEPPCFFPKDKAFKPSPLLLNPKNDFLPIW